MRERVTIYSDNTSCVYLILLITNRLASIKIKARGLIVNYFYVYNYVLQVPSGKRSESVKNVTVSDFYPQ